MKYALITILFIGFQLISKGQEDSLHSNSKPNVSNHSNKQTISISPPEFSGGDVGLFKYLSKKTKYPKELKDTNIQGTVYIVFPISYTGEIEKDSIRIAQSVHPLIDKEAIKIINKMPKWKPAIDQNGNPIKMWYKLPINFKK